MGRFGGFSLKVKGRLAELERGASGRSVPGAVRAAGWRRCGTRSPARCAGSARRLGVTRRLEPAPFGGGGISGWFNFFYFINSWLKDWLKSLPLLCEGSKVQPGGWRGWNLGGTCHPRAARIGKGMMSAESSFDSCDSGIGTVPEKGVCVQSPSEALRYALVGNI